MRPLLVSILFFLSLSAQAQNKAETIALINGLAKKGEGHLREFKSASGKLHRFKLSAISVKAATKKAHVVISWVRQFEREDSDSYSYIFNPANITSVDLHKNEYNNSLGLIKVKFNGNVVLQNFKRRETSKENRVPEVDVYFLENELDFQQLTAAFVLLRDLSLAKETAR